MQWDTSIQWKNSAESRNFLPVESTWNPTEFRWKKITANPVEFAMDSTGNELRDPTELFQWITKWEF